MWDVTAGHSQRGEMGSQQSNHLHAMQRSRLRPAPHALDDDLVVLRHQPAGDMHDWKRRMDAQCAELS